MSGFPFVVLVAGLAALVSGALTARHLRTVAGRLAAVRADPDGDDRVVVTGRVTTAADRAGPVSGDPCVGYLLAREYHLQIRAGVPIRVWRPKLVTTGLGPFTLDTGSETVSIRPYRADRFARLATEPPEGLFADHRLTRDAVSDGFDPDEPAPEPVRAAFDGLPTTRNRHRYVEYRIEPGDRLSVVGTADGGSVTDDDGLVVVDGGRWRLLVGPLVRSVGFAAFTSLMLVVLVARL